MGLGFLTPLFLAGLALLAVPVILHLQQRHRSRTLAFPSLMFLRRIEQPSVRRRRIRHWPLLLLRVLACTLLVLAFARPLLEQEATAADRLARGRELVVVLDNSFSLGFQDRWDRALDSARAALRELGEGDRASLVVFSDRAALVADSTSDPLQVEALLDRVRLSSRTTRLVPGLKLARRAVVDSPMPRREVLLITDFQRLSWEPGEDVRFPSGTEVGYVDLSSARNGEGSVSNLTVASAAFDRSREDDRERITVQARVTRRGGAAPAAARLALELDGRELESRELSLAADSSSVVTFEPLSLPPGASRGRLELGRDALETDNELFFVLSRAQSLPVLLLEAPRDRGTRSGLYVEEALRLGQEPLVEVRRRSPEALAAADLAAAAVVVASDVDLDRRTVEQLAGFVGAGGGLLVALGSRGGETLERLSAAGLAPPGGSVEAGSAGSGVRRLSVLDRTYPGFEPFARPRSGDFGSARFFRHWRLEPQSEDRVLARYDDGGAALLERRVGEGRVLIWTSSLDTYWNDFPLQPVFLPFLHQVVRSLASFRPPPAWHTVGDVVEVRAAGEAGQGAGEDLHVETPAGRELTLAAAEPLPLEEKGFYTLSQGDETVRVLAANVDIREADLTAADAEEILAAVRPLGESPPGVEMTRQQTAAESERRQGLWRYLVLLGLALLVSEVFLANRLSTAT